MSSDAYSAGSATVSFISATLFYTAGVGTLVGAGNSVAALPAVFYSVGTSTVSAVSGSSFSITGTGTCIGYTNGTYPVLVKLMDSCVSYQGVTTDVMTGLDHLEGQLVYAWADGDDYGPFAVVDGSITLPISAQSITVGLYYAAQWRSSKLTQLAAQLGTSINMHKNIFELGMVLADTYYKGVKYGPDFDNLDDLPGIEDGEVLAEGTIHTSYDQETFEFPGQWNADSRVCLQAESPKPCTVLAIVVSTDMNE